MKIRKIIIALVCFLLTVTLVACSDTTTNEPKSVGTYVEEKTQEETKEEVKESKFEVGEKVEFENIIATLVEVSESKGSTYNKPDEGNVYVLCEFEIENKSSSEITVSSVLSFDAYCDGYSLGYSLDALIDKGNKNQLDGTVAAGKKIKGVIGYEVPVNWEELEIIYTPDLFGDGITFIAYH